MNRNLTLRYSLVQISYWSIFVVTAGYCSVYLLAHGLSNSAIGVILAVAGLGSALLQPVLAAFADRQKRFSIRQILLFLDGVFCLLAVLLWRLYGGQKVAVGLLFGLCILLLQLMNPFVNALSTQSRGMINFGVARGLGSGAYALVSSVLGYGIRNLGEDILPLVLLVVCILFGICVFSFPFSEAGGSTRQAPGRGAFFARYPAFSGVLLGCVLLYISHCLINNFAIQIVEAKGGDSGDMGVMVAIGACVELPALFAYGKMQKWRSNSFWLRFCAVFFPVKTLATWLVPSVLGLYGTQFFQFFAWGIIAASAVYFAKDCVAPEDGVQGQAYMTMSYTLGSVLGSLLGGTCMDHFGVNATLVITGCVAAVGTVLVVSFAKKASRI